ncbi:MAG: hypothetical protein WC454_07395 [Phycisphaerae bacterium]
MAQKQADKHDDPTDLMPNVSSSPVSQKSSRTLWIISLILIPSFFFAISLFSKYYKGSPTDWWNKDYNAGIALAKQKNKPALICFYKQGTRFSSDMWQDVYSKSDVKKYVLANYIPILIDVEKQTELAKRYKVTYYPTHYVENPNTNQSEGPFIGAHRLFEFIKNPRDFARKGSQPR